MWRCCGIDLLSRRMAHIRLDPARLNSDQLELECQRTSLPAAVVEMCELLFEHVAALERQIADLAADPHRARKEATVRRLMGIPGIGPICATALEALAPPPETFVKGRDFGSGSFHDNIPRRVRRDLGVYRRWDSGIYGAY